MPPKSSGDLRFTYPATSQGVRMPPMERAFEGQLSALPLSVEPPYDDPFEPHPLDGRSTRNIVRENWPQIGTMTAQRNGRVSRSILEAPAQSGALVAGLIAEQGQIGALGMLRGDLAAERVVQTVEPAPVDWTRQSRAAQRSDEAWRQIESVPYPDDDVFDPDDNLPIELRAADRQILDVEQLAAAQAAERQRAAQDLLRFTQAAAEAEQISRAALQDQNSQSSSIAVSSLLTKGSASLKTAPSTKPLMQPIFEPLHNAREIAKQLVLLEDHLAHPSRRCHDCIRKHLLTAEGLADEAVTLDEAGVHRDRFRAAAQELRDIAKVFTAGGDRDRLQSRVREMRKQMSKDGFGAMEDRTPEHINAEHAQGMTVSGSAAIAPAAAPAPARFSLGDMVASRVRGQWYPGQVVAIESGGTVIGIQIINPASYGSKPAKTGRIDATFKGKEIDSLVIRLNKNPISSEMKGKQIRGYKVDGTTISGTPVVLRPEQMFFADLIQAVFNKVIDDSCGLVGVGDHLMAGQGCTVNASAQLARMAVLTAWYETRLNPSLSNTKKPDDSWGLFQLNRNGGIGKGHEPSTLLDPVENSKILAGVVKKKISIFAPLIKREAALQPTSVGEWITVFTKQIQRPASPDLSAQARAKTANQVFPARPGNSLAPAKEPVAAPKGAAVAPEEPVASPTPSRPAPLAPSPAPSLLGMGNALRAEDLTDRFPHEAGEIMGLDGAVSKILENRAAPIDLDSEDAKIIARAARGWLGLGRRTRFPPASMRAAYLYRLCADMKGYVEALSVVRDQTQGTTMATEADTLIADAIRVAPGAKAKPPETPKETLLPGGLTPQNAIMGAGLIVFGVTVVAALRARSSVQTIRRGSP